MLTLLVLKIHQSGSQGRSAEPKQILLEPPSMSSDAIHVPIAHFKRSARAGLGLLHPLVPTCQAAVLLRISPHLPAGTAGRQKRLLARAEHAIALALALAHHVARWDVLHRAVVPDGDVAGVLPADARLDVVVLGDELLDHGHEPVALFLGHAFEAAAVHAAREDGVPAGDRVRADGRVDGVESEADVGGGAAGAFVGALGAAGLSVVRIAPLDLEALEEFLEGLAQPVVQVVCAGVHGVASCLRDQAEAQRGIIGRVFLKGHVAVPLVGALLALLGVGLVAVSLGNALRNERDHLGIVAIKRVEGIGHDVVLSRASRGDGDAVDDLLVGFIVEVLISEHCNTTLGDWDKCLVMCREPEYKNSN